MTDKLEDLIASLRNTMNDTTLDRLEHAEMRRNLARSVANIAKDRVEAQSYASEAWHNHCLALGIMLADSWPLDAAFGREVV